jgi:lipopolysaccharide export system protein LptA
MACKFHAFMTFPPSTPRFLLPPRCAALLLALVVVMPVHAEKADRFKPLNVEADQPGKIDLQNQFVVFNGNVVVTKGSMVIRAERIEVRETPDGYHTAVAFGSAGKPATFRQKRDGADEYIDGQADRLEYDGKTDTVKFVNHAVVQRLRGNTPADEITGNLVTYNGVTEVFNVSGGAATPSNPGGRVRAVLSPRETEEPASGVPQTTAPLQPSTTLGAPR